MSFKFCPEGACVPTEVKNGNLILWFDDKSMSMPFGFLKDDFEFNNIGFQMSNIMCYLKREDKVVVMRFDGTVTTYNKDMTVIGFSTFDPSNMFSEISRMQIGSVAYGKFMSRLDKCNIYMLPDGDTMMFERCGDIEPIVFSAEKNPKYVSDLAKGTHISPRLIKHDENEYYHDREQYMIEGTPLKLTGFEVL